MSEGAKLVGNIQIIILKDINLTKGSQTEQTESLKMKAQRNMHD